MEPYPWFVIDKAGAGIVPEGGSLLNIMKISRSA
jgi:hypothetical protein